MKWLEFKHRMEMFKLGDLTLHEFSDIYNGLQTLKYPGIYYVFGSGNFFTEYNGENFCFPLNESKLYELENKIKFKVKNERK